MTIELLADLAVFCGAVLLVTLYGLTVAGHFPAEYRAPVLRSGAGLVLLWATFGLTVIAGLLTLWAASSRIPWYYGMIGAGAMILAAPLLLQPLPDRFVDGRRALVAFSVGAMALAAALEF